MRKVTYLAVIFGILWFLWSLAVPSWTYRYRLALEVQVGDRVVTGSSVIQVVYTNVRRISLNGQEYQYHVTGQAVAVDLGERGILFALLKDDGPLGVDHPAYIARKVFAGAPGKIAPPEILPRITGAKAEVPVGLLPMLVRFRDIDDPLTVEKVDPRDLGRSFGPDVRLKRATIEMVPAGWWPFNALGLSWPVELTGVPQDGKMFERIPWLTKYKNKRLDGARFENFHAPNRLLNSLAIGSFTTERSQ